jgi:hypothetical protein
MLDDEELTQIINEQNIKILELEEKVKLLSSRVDKLIREIANLETL